MNKEIEIMLSAEAQEVFNELIEKAESSKVERSVLVSFYHKKELLKANPHYGDPISKQLIPGEYIIEYGVTNLFRVELSNYWRMLYTLTNDEMKVKIIAFVLDIMDHKKYNKKFKYK